MASNGNITITNATIRFRNFAGRAGQYNREGDRNFCVFLDEATARQLMADGWNVKFLRAREPGDADQPYLQVTVGYGKSRPPKVVMVTSRGKTELDEDMVMVLDWVDIREVDLIIRPYSWTVSGRSGVKAYLKSIYITILEDELELKYADVPQIGYSAPLQLTSREEFVEGEVVE